MKRKLKIFKSWVDNDKISIDDVLTSYRSWRGHMLRGNEFTKIQKMDKYFHKIFNIYPIHIMKPIQVVEINDLKSI